MPSCYAMRRGCGFWTFSRKNNSWCTGDQVRLLLVSTFDASMARGEKISLASRGVPTDCCYRTNLTARGCATPGSTSATRGGRHFFAQALMRNPVNSSACAEKRDGHARRSRERPSSSLPKDNTAISCDRWNRSGWINVIRGLWLRPRLPRTVGREMSDNDLLDAALGVAT